MKKLKILSKGGSCTPATLRRNGIRLKWLNSGLYKTVYSVPGLPVVVKVPKVSSKDEDAKQHVSKEAENFKLLGTDKKYEKIRSYVPTVYFSGGGVMLMRKYRMGVTDYEAEVHKSKIRKVIREERLTDDLHAGNLAFSGKIIKIIDLGF